MSCGHAQECWFSIGNSTHATEERVYMYMQMYVYMYIRVQTHLLEKFFQRGMCCSWLIQRSLKLWGRDCFSCTPASGPCSRPERGGASACEIGVFIYARPLSRAHPVCIDTVSMHACTHTCIHLNTSTTYIRTHAHTPTLNHTECIHILKCTSPSSVQRRDLSLSALG